MNWCLDLSWKSLGLKMQSMCAPRAKLWEHLYSGFWLHLAGGDDHRKGDRVHGPGFLKYHLRPALHVCSQFWIKSLGNCIRVQARSILCPNHRMTAVEGIVEWSLLTTSPIENSRPPTALISGIPAPLITSRMFHFGQTTSIFEQWTFSQSAFEMWAETRLWARTLAS